MIARELAMPCVVASHEDSRAVAPRVLPD
ncbi:hypothetical protein [Haloechinothrix alba]